MSGGNQIFGVRSRSRFKPRRKRILPLEGAATELDPSAARFEIAFPNGLSIACWHGSLLSWMRRNVQQTANCVQTTCRWLLGGAWIERMQLESAKEDFKTLGL